MLINCSPFLAPPPPKKSKNVPPQPKKSVAKKAARGGGDVRGQQPVQGQDIPPPFYVGVIGLKKALFLPFSPHSSSQSSVARNFRSRFHGQVSCRGERGEKGRGDYGNGAKRGGGGEVIIMIMSCFQRISVSFLGWCLTSLLAIKKHPFLAYLFRHELGDSPSELIINGRKEEGSLTPHPPSPPRSCLSQAGTQASEESSWHGGRS